MIANKTLPGIVVALGVAVVATAPATAQTVTDHVTFSVSDFGSFPSATPPYDPVAGAFTITFNPLDNYVNQTSGITLNSLNLPLDSAISFNYCAAATCTPSVGDTITAGTLQIGGIADGAGLVVYSPATNDFVMTINTFASSPSFQNLTYANVSTGNFVFFTTQSSTSSLSVTAVPEPADLTLFGTGLAGLGLYAWFKRRKAPADLAIA